MAEKAGILKTLLDAVIKQEAAMNDLGREVGSEGCSETDDRVGGNLEFVRGIAAARLFLEEGTRRLVLADGSWRNIVDIGKGPALVFVPMLRELNCLYVPQLQRFSRDRRVIIYEPQLRERGPLKIEDRVTELRDVLDALAIERADVMAWSDTGAVAYLFAREFSDRCRSLVLMGLPDRYHLPWLLHALARVLWHLPVEGISPKWLVRRLLGHYMGGPRIDSAWIEEEIASVEELPRILKWSCLPNLIDHNARASEVVARTLILCGTDDRVVSIADCERLQRLIPAALNVVVVSGGEHLLPYANAGEINEVIAAFLDQPDSGTSYVIE